MSNRQFRSELVFQYHPETFIEDNDGSVGRQFWCHVSDDDGMGEDGLPCCWIDDRDGALTTQIVDQRRDRIRALQEIVKLVQGAKVKPKKGAVA